jgi:hypothetical protein
MQNSSCQTNWIAVKASHVYSLSEVVYFKNCDDLHPPKSEVSRLVEQFP